MRALFHISDPFMPEVVAGATRTIHEIALGLRRRGVAVMVLARSNAGGPIFMVDERHGYPVWRAHNSLSVLPWAALEFGADSLHLSGSRMLAGQLAALDLGLPAVVTLHNLEMPSWGGPLLPDPRFAYVANSRHTAARAAAMFGVSATVIHPLIRLDDYRVEPRREAVVFINPVPEKGFEIGLKLAAARPSIPFLFVEGWRHGDVIRQERFARTQSLPNIEWVAPLSDPRPHYARARLLLAPSQWEEAFARVVPEAQISGIPVLASAQGALPDTVGPGGIVVPATAPLDDWLAALDRMWEDEAEWRRLSQLARTHAERQELRADEIVDTYLRVSEALIAGQDTA